MHRRGALLTLLFLTACSAPRGPLVIDSPDPAIKIPAMKSAVRRHDKSKIRKLIAQLDSDDAAVRFYAIESLKDLTGETFGYVYYQDDDERKPAVEKWQQWLKVQDEAATQPARNEPKSSPGGGKS